MIQQLFNHHSRDSDDLTMEFDLAERNAVVIHDTKEELNHYHTLALHLPYYKTDVEYGEQFSCLHNNMRNVVENPEERFITTTFNSVENKDQMRREKLLFQTSRLRNKVTCERMTANYYKGAPQHIEGQKS